MGFYQYACTRGGIDPQHTLFVDDKLENVLTARSFGMHGIVFDDPENVARQIRNLCEDPITRGRSFLGANKRGFASMTQNGIVINEVFLTTSQHAMCTLMTSKFLEFRAVDDPGINRRLLTCGLCKTSWNL